MVIKSENAEGFCDPGFINGFLVPEKEHAFESMTLKEIREKFDALAADAGGLESVRATLIVNCREGRILHLRGCRYDESKGVVPNLVSILERLTLGVQTAP